MQNRFAALLDPLALTLDDGFVFVEKQACFEVLAFRAALDGFSARKGRIVAGEAYDQIVLHGDEESRAARIALPASASAQLIVDPAAFVAVHADYVKTAKFGHARAKLDIDAAARHIRRDRHRAAF